MPRDTPDPPEDQGCVTRHTLRPRASRSATGETDETITLSPGTFVDRFRGAANHARIGRVNRTRLCDGLSVSVIALVALLVAASLEALRRQASAAGVAKAETAAMSANP